MSEQQVESEPTITGKKAGKKAPGAHQERLDALLEEMKRQDIRLADGAYRLEDVALYLHSDAVGLRRDIANDKILAVPGEDGDPRFPAIQFIGGALVRGLDRVLRAMPTTDPWFRLHWLVNPYSDLGGQVPLAMLAKASQVEAKEGDRIIERVVAAATMVGEMGS